MKSNTQVRIDGSFVKQKSLRDQTSERNKDGHNEPVEDPLEHEEVWKPKERAPW